MVEFNRQSEGYDDKHKADNYHNYVRLDNTPRTLSAIDEFNTS